MNDIVVAISIACMEVDPFSCQRNSDHGHACHVTSLTIDTAVYNT